MAEEETGCSVSRAKEICCCFSPRAACRTIPRRLPRLSATAPLPDSCLCFPASCSHLQPPAAASKLPRKPAPSPHLGFYRLATRRARLARAPLVEPRAGLAGVQRPSQPLSCTEVVPLPPPVCQVCLKLAELSRVGRWMDNDS